VRHLLELLAAVNPPAVAVALWPREHRSTAALAAGLTWLLGVAAAALSGPILDALDVSAATFRVATGIVIGLAAARWLFFGASAADVDTAPRGWRRVAIPLLIPTLVSPQLAMAAISNGADEGVLVVAWTAAVSLALAWLAATVAKRRRTPWSAATRFVGALGIAVAFALVVDGVKSV
jgi:small neutral amino acid transporter SnatA (MarC family)